MISYKLLRSQRKTVAIHITREANLEVRAPLRMPKAEIDRFVLSKEKWIATHLAKIEQRLSEKAAFSLDYGSMVSLRGKQYPIVARNGNLAGFDNECFYIPQALKPNVIKGIIVQLYKAISKRHLSGKAAEYAAIMNVTPAAVKINSAKTRWGSCSDKNSVNFSWRLIMADEDVIDYVVVHELSHIKEHNHSARFWSVVEGVLPDYMARKKKLKLLQKKLATEDWD